MATYRKKSVIVEAWQWDGNSFAGCPQWVVDALYCGHTGVGCIAKNNKDDQFDTLSIPTEAGITIAQPGDFILRDENGFLSRCGQRVFSLCYEGISR